MWTWIGLIALGIGLGLVLAWCLLKWAESAWRPPWW
jgi:hypothetical protein